MTPDPMSSQHGEDTDLCKEQVINTLPPLTLTVLTTIIVPPRGQVRKEGLGVCGRDESIEVPLASGTPDAPPGNVSRSVTVGIS